MLGAYLRDDKHRIARDLAAVYALFPVLKERARQQAGPLSGGQQPTVAIGRALMGRPTLLLLDEPSVGIAHRLKMQIFAAIRAIRDAGTAVLLVEQDARSTLAVGDRIYVLEPGRFAREDTKNWRPMRRSGGSIWAYEQAAPPHKRARLSIPRTARGRGPCSLGASKPPALPRLGATSVPPVAARKNEYMSGGCHAVIHPMPTSSAGLTLTERRRKERLTEDTNGQWPECAGT